MRRFAIVALFASASCALPHGAIPRDDDARTDARATDAVAITDIADEAVVTHPDVPPTCSAGQVVCAGSCTSLNTDATNCGSCGTVCSFANASATCTGGMCAFGACAAGYSNCDHDPANGCETTGPCPAFASCLAVVGGRSGVYTLGTPPNTWSAYCDLTDDGGGWTLVLKADGTQSTFTFAAPLWVNATTLNESSTNLDRVEAKFLGFSTLAVQAIRVAMYDPTDTMTRSITLTVTASSLMQAFATGTYVPSAAGRAAWEALMSSGSLQPNCNREGLNAATSGPSGSSVRIGILGNDQTDCNSPNSRIGVGGAGSTASACDPAADATNAVGNEAHCSSDNGDRDTHGFAYVFVR
jgi:hypothetical protein